MFKDKCLTHLCLMGFPTFIIWISPFPFKGCWVVIFLFQIFIEHSVNKQWRPCSVASDLGLHCLPIPTKRTQVLYGLKHLKLKLSEDV